MKIYDLKLNEINENLLTETEINEISNFLELYIKNNSINQKFQNEGIFKLIDKYSIFDLEGTNIYMEFSKKFPKYIIEYIDYFDDGKKNLIFNGNNIYSEAPEWVYKNIEIQDLFLNESKFKTILNNITDNKDFFDFFILNLNKEFKNLKKMLLERLEFNFSSKIHAEEVFNAVDMEFLKIYKKTITYFLENLNNKDKIFKIEALYKEINNINENNELKIKFNIEKLKKENYYQYFFNITPEIVLEEIGKSFCRFSTNFLHKKNIKKMKKYQ